MSNRYADQVEPGNVGEARRSGEIKNEAGCEQPGDPGSTVARWVEMEAWHNACAVPICSDSYRQAGNGEPGTGECGSIGGGAGSGSGSGGRGSGEPGPASGHSRSDIMTLHLTRGRGRDHCSDRKNP